MWLFPVLSILIDRRASSPCWCRWPSTTTPAPSCCSACSPGPSCWCSTSLTSWRGGSVEPDRRPPEPAAPAERVLVLANETVDGDELIDELRAIDRAGQRRVLRLRSGEPDRHRAGDARRGCVRRQATVEAAQARLDRTLEILRGEGLTPTARSATTGRCTRWPGAVDGVQARPAGHLHPPRGALGLAAPRCRPPGAPRPLPAGDPRGVVRRSARRALSRAEGQHRARPRGRAGPPQAVAGPPAAPTPGAE